MESKLNLERFFKKKKKKKEKEKKPQNSSVSEVNDFERRTHLNA